jgi:NodT family efflux transporter outer membrane factor (OMF) lipoprotein
VKSKYCLAVVALLLQSCAYKPHPVDTAALPSVERWEAKGGEAALERDWWRGFRDPVLTKLVEEARVRNSDLRLAAARVAEARALAAAQRGAQLPSLALGASGERARKISDVTLKPYQVTGGQIQFQAAYEVDLWGRESALTRASTADAQAIQTARDSSEISIAALVAASYVNLRTTDAQLEVARQTLVSRQNSLNLTRSLHAQGYSSALDAAQAESEYRATAQAIPQLELSVRRQELALNVLLARPPGPIERGQNVDAMTPPALPNAGLPSQLLRRRPDIVSAEINVIAADARLYAARAQMLPSLNLLASDGVIGASIFTGDPFKIWSIGGSILAPLFNGGRLRSLADASASRRDQALLTYERTVLTSFAEVETQLIAFAKARERTVQLVAQREAARDALRISDNRYREGYSSYLDNLLAQRNLYSVEQSLLEGRADLLNAQINVYKALGGGWAEGGE